MNSSAAGIRSPTRTVLRVTGLACVVASSISATQARDGSGESAIDFNRDIRPLLSDRCFKCHGPDAAARQADLRLDDAADSSRDRRDGRAAITPGNLDGSLVWERISSDDPGVRMPPPESGRSLSPVEIERIRRWIESGATRTEHWSFIPPRDVTPPTPDSTWPRNPIDQFVLARLDAGGITPAPEADRATLLRRVTFDLTGLPPTIDELDAFFADRTPDAYERAVDRLLSSLRYGERMAVPWLDGARYADTHGYHYDNERSMWRWRDWVIDAYNRNMPFDRFTIEQLAGDLLDDATIDQRVATGFNRNHGISWEGGIIPEEYRVEYVVDRVDTTSTVWLGLTVGCARCHDHKFDPISQKEFYQLTAFFNTIPEKGADGLEGNAVPLIPAPDETHAGMLAAIDTTIESLQSRYDAPDETRDLALAEWEADTADRWRRTWTVLEPFTSRTDGGATLVPQADGSLFAEGPHPGRDTYELVAFTHVTGIRALRLEAMADTRLPDGGPGRAVHSNYVLSELELEVAPIDDPTAARPVEWLTAHADHCQPGFFITKTIDGRAETGWAVNGARYGEDRVALFIPTEPIGFEGGTALRIRIRQDSNYPQHAIGRIRLAVTTEAELAGELAPSSFGPWHLAGPFLSDSARGAHDTEWSPERGIDLGAALDDGADDTVRWQTRPDLENGRVHALDETPNAATYLHRVITTPTARRVTFSLGSDDAFKLWINGTVVATSDAPRPAAADQDILSVDLQAGDNDLLLKVTNYGGECGFYFDPRDDHGLELPLDLLGALNRPPPERTAEQVRELRDHFIADRSPEGRRLIADLEARRAERALLLADVPTVMVMSEMSEPRESFVLVRGRYDAPGEPVTAGVPAFLPALTDSGPTDRLTLARWLTRPDHPLTARVAVNRYWQMHFGTGLVRTPEDFGSQGAAPTHADLLDWLAREFVRTGWDVKSMHRLIVTSATYRQRANATAAEIARDPSNTQLARGPRFRMAAETIRDAALSWSGLLVNRIGGPPVKPYQPSGLWREVGSEGAAFSANVYERDFGEALYRRSMYTFWKRTLPPPSLQTFDAPTREFCVVRRSRTNTPLQALVLLNDPTYLEAARFIAQRLLTETGPDATPEERATLAFRVVTSRHPTARELELIVSLFREQRTAFEEDPDSVRGLLGVGDAPHADALDRVDLAAWTVVASTLLNLDEAITRG